MAIKILATICVLHGLASSHDYVISPVEPGDCRLGEEDLWHEYYDNTQMECAPCSQNTTYQWSDGEECYCNENYIKQRTTVEGTITWTCVPCPRGKVAAKDGWTCVDCQTAQEAEEICPDCPDSKITAERDLNGTFLNEDPTKQCIECVTTTHPNNDNTRCEFCYEIQRVMPSMNKSCICPAKIDGYCFQSNDDIEELNRISFTVTYENGMQLTSALFADNLRRAQAACTNYSRTSAERIDYSNLEECQFLANLCVLTMYSAEYRPQNIINDACSLHLRLVNQYADSRFEPHKDGPRALQDRIQEWKANMPWLYYLNDQADDIINADSIVTEFRSGDRLQIKAAKYNAEGHFMGIFDFSDGEIDLCKKPRHDIDTFFNFGTRKGHKCKIVVASLFEDEQYSTYFYDLYLQYTRNGEERLMAIPVLIANYVNEFGVAVNQGERENWQLVRRLFAVDRISGVETSGGEPSVVHYISKMTLNIQLKEAQGRGRIVTPFLKVTYRAATLDDKFVESSFAIDYTMPLRSIARDLSIAMAVMSALAAMVSIFQTSTWMRRQGILSIECSSIIKFSMILCGHLCSAFFLVIVGFSLWWFILYKEQDVMFIVPTKEANSVVIAYIVSSFVLSLLDIVHLVYSQVTIEIFFIDWEKAASPRSKDSPSAYRTIFVANEWNEIQTLRKVKPVFTLIGSLFVLVVLGVENLARFDTESSLDAEKRGEFSTICRFALGVSIYIGTAFVQWIFYLLLWSRCLEHAIYNFVDLCTMSNVSMFIMTHDQFGHYVHGRSVHGRADVGLRQMADDLAKEEDDLCSHRGLANGSDQQTFEVYIPKKLRSQYQKVLNEHVLAMSHRQRQARTRGGYLSDEMQHKLEAYKILNQFLQSFIDHNLKNINYRIVDKSLYEKILDTEKISDFNTGYFYNDYGHSFDRALFYGQERRLLLFNVLCFAVFDLIAHNFVLSAFLTFFVDLILRRLRNGLGKNNLAKKSLIDKVFLN